MYFCSTYSSLFVGWIDDGGVPHKSILLFALRKQAKWKLFHGKCVPTIFVLLSEVVEDEGVRIANEWGF